MITTNIDVYDGLDNGALGKLHLQRNDNDELSRVRIVFPHHRVREKLKKKVAGCVNRNNFDQNAVPIRRRNATMPLDKNKTVNAKRDHFRLLMR